MKVVIDTNIFISSFFNKKGNPRKIINLWKEEKIQLCISSEILEEYLGVLSRFVLAGEPELKELLNLFKRKVNILYKPITIKIALVKNDPDDNKFIECAVTNKADYIISGDNHLLSLREYENIKILSPKEFLNYYKS
ncbi:MAG: putative toxin-antitoxin system toxin component, PIN family [Actinobacteria bacterium]|nr:MAG: putative toxin-antitoxin system toxin component, PIN family [Actinomycetota bacterium]